MTVLPRPASASYSTGREQPTSRAIFAFGTPLATRSRDCATDGFVIMPALYPTSLEEFVTGVVPELQRRGRFRCSYDKKTLRGHLGLQT